MLQPVALLPSNLAPSRSGVTEWAGVREIRKKQEKKKKKNKSTLPGNRTD